VPVLQSDIGIFFIHEEILFMLEIKTSSTTMSGFGRDTRQKNSCEHLESVEKGLHVNLEDPVNSCSMQPVSGDPIDWPQWKKNVMIIMVSFHSMTSVFMAAGIVPAVSSMAKTYGVSLADASYLVSIQVSIHWV
jgi:hypothetical protein